MNKFSKFSYLHYCHVATIRHHTAFVSDATTSDISLSCLISSVLHMFVKTSSMFKKMYLCFFFFLPFSCSSCASFYVSLISALLSLLLLPALFWSCSPCVSSVFAYSRAVSKLLVCALKVLFLPLLCYPCLLTFPGPFPAFVFVFLVSLVSFFNVLLRTLL